MSNFFWFVLSALGQLILYAALCKLLEQRLFLAAPARIGKWLFR